MNDTSGSQWEADWVSSLSPAPYLWPTKAAVVLGASDQGCMGGDISIFRWQQNWNSIWIFL